MSVVSESGVDVASRTELAAARQPVLVWNNVSFQVKETRILQNVSGALCKGEVACILGSSGAGKSTLLDSLSGRLRTGQVTGQVKYLVPSSRVGYIQQQDVLLATASTRETLEYAAKLSNFKEPEISERVSSVLRDLGLSSCAEVKAGGPMIRGLSGGQRRRLSIGIALIKGADVLLLDEITSGLDSFSALKVIQLLRTLADTKGCTCICTVHQPSFELLKLFDKIILMAKGQMAYYGTVDGAIPHFESIGRPVPPLTNPADYMLSITSPMSVYSLHEHEHEHEHWHVHENGDGSLTAKETKMDEEALQRQSVADAKYVAIMQEFWNAAPRESQGVIDAALENPTGFMVEHGNGLKQSGNSIFSMSLKKCMGAQPMASPASPTSAAPSGVPATLQEQPRSSTAPLPVQFAVLFKRTLRNYTRDPILLSTQVVAYLFMSVFVGLLYLQIGDNQASIYKRVASFFMSLCTFAFVPSLSIIASFPAERAVFWKEREDSMYSSLSYYAAYVGATLPFEAFYVFLYSVISYFMIGYDSHDAGKFFLYFGILLLFEQVNSALSLTLAAISKTVDVGNVLASIVITIFLSVGGFVTQSDQIGWWFYPFKYTSFFLYAQEALSLNEFQGTTFTCSDGPCIATGQQALDTLGYSVMSITGDCMVLLGMLVFYRILGYVAVSKCRFGQT
eukprot:ANDGO_07412.mRNA.1 ABC transporter G family member 22